MTILHIDSSISGANSASRAADPAAHSISRDLVADSRPITVRLAA